MKRFRKFAFPLTLLLLGVASGHWVSTAYGSADSPLSAQSRENELPGASSLQSLHRASRGVSSVKMPFFDFRKGS